MSKPFNNPRFQQPVVVLDSNLLKTVIEAQSKHQTIRPNYKRYAICADCSKGKIFVCYKNGEKSCKKMGATHTHFKCECGGGRDLIFAGEVQFATKQDR